MALMGHASAHAALIYQHASEERDVLIAERLSAMTQEGWEGPRATQTADHDLGQRSPNATADDAEVVVYLWSVALCSPRRITHNDVSVHRHQGLRRERPTRIELASSAWKGERAG